MKKIQKLLILLVCCIGLLCCAVYANDFDFPITQIGVSQNVKSEQVVNTKSDVAQKSQSINLAKPKLILKPKQINQVQQSTIITVQTPEQAKDKNVITPKQTTNGHAVQLAKPTLVKQIENKENQFEEKWLELEWNKWHAKVVNTIYQNNYCVFDMWKKNAFAYSFYVNKDKTLFNVVVYYIPNTTVDINPHSEKFMWVSVNQPFYAYSLDENAFFEITVNKDAKMSKNTLVDIIKSSSVSQFKEKEVPRAKHIRKSAENITRLETVFPKTLEFPQGSQRTKVLVTAFYYASTKGGDYTEKSFNDVEKIKVMQ